MKVSAYGSIQITLKFLNVFSLWKMTFGNFVVAFSAMALKKYTHILQLQRYNERFVFCVPGNCGLFSTPPHSGSTCPTAGIVLWMTDIAIEY